MADYIITEKQEKLLKEIWVAEGKFNIHPVVLFYRYLVDDVLQNKKKKILKLVRLFFKEELGSNIDKWSDDAIEFYLSDIKNNETSSIGWNSLKGYPSFFKKPSTIVSLSYFLMKNLFKVYEFEGLEYVKNVDNPFYKFYFFDPEIQEFVGYLETRKSLLLPGKSMQVILSAVEKEYVGRGYGSRMYLCIINQVDYLMSDSTLYPDSLNMWVNYLPRKVNVWAATYELDSNSERKIVQLSPKNFVKSDNIEYLVASAVRTEPPKL